MNLRKAAHFLSLSLCCLILGIFPKTHKGQSLVEGFSDTEYLKGFTGLTGMTFDQNGNMYVWEKRGRVYSIDANKKKNLVINIDEEVGNWRDFGMLGLALDPAYFQNGFIYLYYVVDRHHLLHFGKPSYNPNADDYFDATIGRITRFKVNNPGNPSQAKANYGSRRVLLGEGPGTGPIIIHQSHGTGHLVFGTDGSLMVSVGDGASYQGIDEGSQSTTYWQQALADGIMGDAENIGTYRSQVDYSLSGKLLRIDPATGDGLPSNPYYQANQPRSPQSRIWAFGFRNPFRFCLRPNSGSHIQSQGDPGVFYVGDVGWNNGEELNVVENAGENFGWPKYEGMTHQPGYNKSKYRPSNHKLAALDWRKNAARASVNGNIHNVGSNAVPGESFIGNSSTGGTWYTGLDFPTEYQNTYFHADYGGKWIKNIVFDANNTPVEVREFASDLGAVVFLASSPIDGALYYIRYDENSLHKISHNNSGNQAPVAKIFADKTYGPGPLTVNFNAFQSYDPEGKSLKYRWRFDDGKTSNSANPGHTFTGNGIQTFNVRLVVTDSEGLKAEEFITISINNSPPKIQSTTIDKIDQYPLDRPLTLNLDVDAVDAEHAVGSLSYAWQVFLYHNDHNHPEAPIPTKVTQTEISPIGCDGETYWYKIVVTVTDPGGLSSSFEKDIYPACPGRKQSISFGPLENKLTTDGSFTVNATASSRLDVVFYIASGPATIDGRRITLLGTPGTVTVRATQPGNDQYSQAIPIEQRFEVNIPGTFRNQSIRFDPIPDKFTTDPPFRVNPTASSGLPVELVLLSGPATLNGKTLTLTGEGKVTLQANQKGNNLYNAAPSVEQSFQVIDPTVPPEVILSYPTEGEVVIGSNFTATYSLDGYLGKVKYLRYTLDNGQAVILDEFTEAFDLTDVPAGNHVLKVELLDEGQRVIPVEEATEIVKFGISCESPKGLIYRKYYRNIQGNKISDLTSSNKFPDRPSGQDQLNKFEGPERFGNNYGTFVQGFLHPSATGKHRFYITGDNHVELYLSRGDRPEEKQLIANITGSTKIGQLDKYESQTSNAFDLEAGKRYYIELLHKEGKNNDHFAVYWTSPQIDTPTIIESDFLSPYIYCIDNRKFQAISFDPITDRQDNAPSFELKASSTAGLPIVFSVLSGPAEVTGNTLTLTGGAGVVTVKAEQPGNLDFHAAPEVLQSFEVYDHSLPTGITILSPAANAILYSPELNVNFLTTGYAGNVGFIKVQLDEGEPVYIDAAEEGYSYSNLAEGDHSVRLTLVDTDKKAFPNPEAKATVDFTISCSAPLGNILFERWQNVEGISVNDLVNAPNYPMEPHERGELASFAGERHILDNYGTRVRGFLHPPATGAYTFAVTGDNNVELWLGVNEFPETATKIASIEGWTRVNQLNKYASQESEAIELTGGKKYYIELLHKELDGGDHFSVFWKAPGGRDDFKVIDGAFLSPWVDCGQSETGRSIEFADFYARYKEGMVELDWTTAYEFNNEFFTIERSEDGNTFEEIANRRAKGNSAVPQHYAAEDPSPLKGRSLYRIRQTNFDGEYSYSHKEVIYVLTGGIEVYPNPATLGESISIDVFIEEIESIQARLTNAMGRTVFLQELDLDPATKETELDISDLSQGVYVLTVFDGKNTYVKKVQVNE